MIFVAVVALLLALGALAAAGVALRAQSAQRRRDAARAEAADLPPDVEALRAEVAALRAELRQSLRHLAVVRYDAFGDTGGHLSWSLAVCDDAGDGVLLSSIHGRSEARAYAKTIAGWASDQQLSPEEAEALAHARG